MPSVLQFGYGNPSTLIDVIGQVIDAFGLVGDATPMQVGKQYLERGAGIAPRVVWVPELSGKIGPPTQTGYAASVTHSCDVYIRGPETGGDLDRFKFAYALQDRIISGLRRAASGHIEFGDLKDDSPAGVDAYGVDLAFRFTYQRNVRNDPAIWLLPKATPDTTPPRQILPQRGEFPDDQFAQDGVAADDIALTGTTVPKPFDDG